jgi:hypothetical protein
MNTDISNLATKRKILVRVRPRSHTDNVKSEHQCALYVVHCTDDQNICYTNYQCEMSLVPAGPAAYDISTDASSKMLVEVVRA